MLLNRNNVIPGGFTWTQAETGWQIRTDSFNETLKKIIEHRRANPRFELPTDDATVAMEMEQRYETDLLARYGDQAAQWVAVSPGGPQPSFTIRHRPSRGGVAVVESAKKLIAGIGLWMEWFGEGPVDFGLADKRAAVCIKCPKNQPAEGANKLSELAAKELAHIMGSLHEKRLATSHDEKLNVCTVCLCPLKAKVWTPQALAVKHTSEKTMSELPDNCWIKFPLDVKAG